MIHSELAGVVAVPCCPLCGSARRQAELGAVHQPLAIVRCVECGMVYANGRYAHGEVDDRYDRRAEARAEAGRSIDVDRKRRAARLYDRLLDGRLHRPPPGAGALDIGCNTGALLDVLRGWGWHTEGIERAPEVAAGTGARHRIHDLDVEDPRSRLDRRYELVTMTHVLEHLDRPAAGLRFVARHLAPGGVAVVEVPNWDDPGRRLWGRRYRPLELGDHTLFFERGTLTAALEATGLRVLHLWSRPQGASSIVPSLLSAADALRELLPGRERPRQDARPTASRGGRTTLRRLALRALDRLDPVLERFGGPARGANVIAIATLQHTTHDA